MAKAPKALVSDSLRKWGMEQLAVHPLAIHLDQALAVVKGLPVLAPYHKHRALRPLELLLVEALVLQHLLVEVLALQHLLVEVLVLQHLHLAQLPLWDSVAVALLELRDGK
jgi:hypothetical protein